MSNVKKEDLVKRIEVLERESAIQQSKFEGLLKTHLSSKGALLLLSDFLYAKGLDREITEHTLANIHKMCTSYGEKTEINSVVQSAIKEKVEYKNALIIEYSVRQLEENGFVTKFRIVTPDGRNLWGRKMYFEPTNRDTAVALTLQEARKLVRQDDSNVGCIFEVRPLVHEIVGEY